MGSIAHLRQAMLDAEHLKQLEAFTAKHGGPHAALRPGAQGPGRRRGRRRCRSGGRRTARDEIHRALDLAEEFGTTAVIVGGREAAKVADRLKAYKVPVVLRLSVPEEPRVPTEAEYRKKPAAERDEPLRVLAHRKAKWKEQLATASVLAKEGIPFAFATDGVDAARDLPANLRKIIGEGLKPDDALAALTAHAAAIAGVEKRLGTIEPGKLGHVIVMTAPFTEERAKVKFVLLDGLKFEVKPEDAARAKGKGGRRTRRPRPARPRRVRREVPSEEDQPDETARRSPEEAKHLTASPSRRKPRRDPGRSPRTQTDRRGDARRARPQGRGTEEGRGPQGREPEEGTQAQEGAGSPRRSSTSPPNWTRIASRRSTPAAACSSRTPRS